MILIFFNLVLACFNVWLGLSPIGSPKIQFPIALFCFGAFLYCLKTYTP